MNQLVKNKQGYSRSPESLKEELATGWGLIDGLLVGLIIGFIAGAVIISRYF